MRNYLIMKRVKESVVIVHDNLTLDEARTIMRAIDTKGVWVAGPNRANALANVRNGGNDGTDA